jgi:cystathionine beta-lyase
VGKDALAIECLGKMPSYAPDKPDEGYDIIPMWISDMNFPTCPTIQSTIIERVNHPFFGYFSPREEYYNSIIEWQKKRNGVNDLKKENIGYENGVLGGVISALNIFCSRGEKILVILLYILVIKKFSKTMAII